MSSDCHIAVIGAGAAGLAAAIFAAENYSNLRIVLVDGARTIGAKILVSGGGRCNVTNAAVTSKDFHAPSRIVERILKRFTEHDTRRWLESLGVVLKQEPLGKIFPVTNKSRSVLNSLLRRCDELRIPIKTRHRVTTIEKKNQRFRILTDSGLITAHRVIMATGGKSLPKSGSDGSGWDITRQLGHTVTECYPSLVPFVLHHDFFHKMLSGTSHEVTITTTTEGKIVDRRTGSLLWTHFGVSGPVVMDASRFWVKAHEEGSETTCSISFLPGQTFKEVEQWLMTRSMPDRRKNLSSYLSQKLPQSVAKVLCSHFQTTTFAPPTNQVVIADRSSPTIGELSRPHRRILTHLLTGLPLPIIRSRGWNYAEVTAGGIPLTEINANTMGSRKVPGLYITGEMLDCDGRIGGFNFQWAWSTGYIAGCKAGEGLLL